ncbi:GNAT family N-acetyltransferase [Mycobacteroides chelonae]|uniref:GNAT family N-acetyltransferase n=1 Tax=Mycobacteroides chelonae TaxID=1774 RepID=UPI0039EA5C0F
MHRPEKFARTVVERRAELADIPALVQLRESMFSAMGLPESSGWQVAAARWFARQLDSPHVGVFVVELDGEVVSGAIGVIRDLIPSPTVPDGCEVSISNVCTLPTVRGHGYARMVFKAVLDWAQGQGAARAELMAVPAGRRLYESLGFTEVEHPAMRMTFTPQPS